jgi:hypothetical protein
MLTENRFGFVYLKEEVLQIADAQIKLESPNALKPYFDYFEEIDYGKIRLALAILEKRMLYIKPTL